MCCVAFSLAEFLLEFDATLNEPELFLTKLQQEGKSIVQCLYETNVEIWPCHVAINTCRSELAEAHQEAQNTNMLIGGGRLFLKCLFVHPIIPVTTSASSAIISLNLTACKRKLSKDTVKYLGVSKLGTL